jgi:16S rRNA (guanine966-N2)-methyltransferase
VRVVAGLARGRRLETDARPGLRPTLDRVREALFSILGDVTGFSVLDLFAGTGALGIEALSRGAAQAVFVERDAATVGLIRRNLEATGLAGRARLQALELPDGLPQIAAQHQPFDLILVDAPYDGDARDHTLSHAAMPTLLAADGRMVVEHDVRRPPPTDIPALEITDQRRYGSTGLVFLEHLSPSREAR